MTITEETTRRIGLIAGSGRFPIVFARAARALGHEVVAVAIRGEAREALGKATTRLLWVELGEFQKVIDGLKAEGIDRVVMAGKIRKTRIYSKSLKLDDRTRALLGGLKDRNDDSILKAFVEELEREGLTVLDSVLFLENLLPEEGCLTGGEPTAEETEDMLFGRRVAREIAGMDIGQTVVVKNKAVLAVEAIEGTDEAILRGGALGDGGVVVVKVAKPNQDKRFDMPVIGLETVKTLVSARARALVVDAGKTIFLDRPEALALAREHGIRIVAMKNHAA